MINDFMSLGGIEIINTARLRAYLANVGSPFDTGAAICSCAQLGPTQLDPDSQPYLTPSTPAGNEAPWYDPDQPESANFLGFLPLSIDGLDDNPVKRTVTTAVTGGGAIGPARVQPRVITVTGLLLGATCCSVDYGLQWLTSALQGCTGNSCGGDCMNMLDCCPSDPEEDYDTFQAKHRRTFRRVVLVDGPTVTARHGNGTCTGTCGKGSDILTVEFTLTAATPWAYTDQTELLNVDLPVGDAGACVEWTTTGTNCHLAECADPVSACADPLCSFPDPPQPTTPQSCFCYALAEESMCYSIDLSNRPNWSSDVPVISIYSGISELRNLRIALYERRPVDAALTCAQIGVQKRCEPVAEWNIGYIPASSELTLDGQVERAMLFCGGSCETATSVWGFQGAAISWPTLDCATYCLCIYSSAITPPAGDAQLIFSVSGKGM